MELLSPCGNYETFLAVVNSGADAVYFAGSKYGARAYADNFSDEEILKAIKYAHLLNVKVYLTVNTLIKEREFKDVIAYITPFYEAGLDACIVQDIGLISAFRTCFPKMECHVSTQSFITSVNSARFFKNLGVTRIVLARELTLPEVIKIKQECSKYDIEIEAFIHGAMCYSYSGQCLFSSCLGGRSGNRGRCAGPCRLEYEAVSSKGVFKEGYLLSMKDQCTLEILPDLIKAGIDSFKIEGRMKRPEYAAFVTSMYRKYIDMYMSSPKDFKISSNDNKLLKSFYMRSEIGTGYYHERNGENMISINNPAYSKTSEELLEKVKCDIRSQRRTHPVSFFINACVGEPLSVSATFKDKYLFEEGDIVTESINRPTTEEDILKHFNKLGDTIFETDNIEINIVGKCFLSVGMIKALRRKIIESLEKELLIDYETVIKKSANPYTDFYKREKNEIKHQTIICVKNEEQLDAASLYIDRAYLAIDYSLALIKDLNVTNIKDLVIDLPKVTREDDIRNLISLFELPKYKNAGFIVNNLEELMLLLDRNDKRLFILGPSVYQWNNTAASFLEGMYDSFIYSYELNSHEIKDLNREGFTNVYGKLPLMQTSNCIEKTISGCNKNQGNEIIYLKDRKNYKLPVFRNCYNCSNTIYNAVPTSLHDELYEGKIDGGIMLSFVDEGYSETAAILSLFLDKNSEYTPKDFTKGYWKRGVE